MKIFTLILSFDLKLRVTRLIKESLFAAIGMFPKEVKTIDDNIFPNTV